MLTSLETFEKQLFTVRDEIIAKFEQKVIDAEIYHRAMFLLVCSCVKENHIELADTILLGMAPNYFKTDFLKHLKNDLFKARAEKALQGLKNGPTRINVPQADA